MVVITVQDTCDQQILKEVKQSDLNFVIQETPFSLEIIIKKKFVYLVKQSSSPQTTQVLGLWNPTAPCPSRILAPCPSPGGRACPWTSPAPPLERHHQRAQEPHCVTHGEHGLHVQHDVLGLYYHFSHELHHHFQWAQPVTIITRTSMNPTGNTMSVNHTSTRGMDLILTMDNASKSNPFKKKNR